MATRAEQYRSEHEREGKTKKPRGPHGARPPSGQRKQKRAGKNASYALEMHTPGKRASRKSTRGSKNRGKPDSALTHTEEMRTSSAKARFRKSRAKGARVRGR